jgi:hypothetical protein
MKKMAFSLSVCLVLASALTAPAAAQASERNTAAEFGLGVASFALTVPYGLVKTAYAVGGSLVGGLAWVLTGGRNDTARAIIQPAVRGDYVVVPEHLLIQRSLVFVGRDPRTQSSYSY